MNFDGLWQILENSVPPEITHYQMGHHPGAGWWLKTAIPSDPQNSLYQAWYAIQQKHPRFVHIEPTAYDWRQTPITHASSIWLNHKVDVTLTAVKDHFQYEIGDYDDSFNYWGKLILKQLKKQKSKDLDQDDWHKLCDVANLMQSWTTDRQARNNRRSLKIVKPEKNTSSANNRSKLDSK